MGTARLERLKPENSSNTQPSRVCIIRSSTPFKRAMPTGIPTNVEIMSRVAESTFRLLHVVKRITIAMVQETRATRGVAVLRPRTIASSGMAIKASPKPNTDLVVVERANMTRVVNILGSKKISKKAPEERTETISKANKTELTYFIISIR